MSKLILYLCSKQIVMNNNSSIPSKIFSRNANIQNYLNNVTNEQFAIDHKKIQKSLAKIEMGNMIKKSK